MQLPVLALSVHYRFTFLVFATTLSLFPRLRRRSGARATLVAATKQAFVKQEDVFYSQLTVRETLLMAARLRLPSSMPLEEKSAMVDKLISKLGLSKVGTEPSGT